MCLENTKMYFVNPSQVFASKNNIKSLYAVKAKNQFVFNRILIRDAPVLPSFSEPLCVSEQALFIAVMYAINVKRNLFIFKALLFLKIIHH